MKLLSLETSTMMGSIALSDDNHLLAEYQIRVKSTYSDIFLSLIDQLLNNAETDLSAIDGFAISIGPGSFTALRIGLSIVKGLALATMKPVAGVSSLDGLAQNITYTDLLICPLLDARRGEVYSACYKKNSASTTQKAITPFRVIKPDDILKEIKEEVVFLGDGSDLYKEKITKKLGEKAFFAPPQLRYPRASSIAFIALEKFKNNEIMDIENLTPLYVRAPDAELNSKKRI